MIAALLALAVAASPSSKNEATYDQAHRVAYLKATIEAVRGTRPDALSNQYEYLAALDRGSCASPTLGLRVSCLVAAAHKFCRNQGASCPLTLDVVLANLLAESQFSSADARDEIMQTHRDYRQEIARRLRRIQGSLAVDFRLRAGGATDDETLARRVDGFCVETADKSNLSWQTCSASLVWFIATSSEKPPEKPTEHT